MDLPTPSLNHWTSFFLLAAGQGIFLAILLFTNKKGNRRADFFLGLLMLIFGITLVDYVGYWSKYNLYYPRLAGVYLPLIFLIGPLLYFYLREKKDSNRHRHKDWIHFIPFLFILIYRLPLFIMPIELKRELLMGNFGEEVTQHFFFFFSRVTMAVLILTHLFFYTYLIFRLVRKMNLQQPVEQKWHKVFCYLYLGFCLSYLAYYLVLSTSLFSILIDYGISLMMTIFIYTVGFLGYKQPEILSGKILPKVFNGKYQTSSLTTNAAQSILKRLIEIMETQKPYLDNELRMTTLAEKINISPHQLSQVVNEYLGKSYPDFVTDYRVEAAKKMLSDPLHLDTYIIDIAYQVGFNNKTSFNKAFKLRTGLSPSAFRKKLAEERFPV